LKIIFQKSSNDAQDIQVASNSEKSSGSNLNSRLKSTGRVSGYREVLYTKLKKKLKEKNQKIQNKLTKLN
jgi:hypothetical protein